MTYIVILLTASILKIVNPEPEGALYIFRDPKCKIHSGTVKATAIELFPEVPSDPIGYIEQDGKKCDMYELVYSGV